MKFETWYFLLGGLMLAVAFVDRYIQRLPITTTIIYLAIGFLLGPFGFSVAEFDPVENSAFLERLSELAVIVSLFTAGLKLKARRGDPQWKAPIRLASFSMLLTVAFVAVVGVTLLELPLGAAILLGAVLAPTDPVLASEVQLEHPGDRDRLRFSLTGEAGLNDGTAFPFVMLGLGLLGLHELGDYGWRWLTVDLLWAVAAGLGIGAALGAMVGRMAVYFRSRDGEAVSRDEFVALGLIGFSYGLALLLHAYGFLAVFAAALALRYTEERNVNRSRAGEELEISAAALRANEQLERILEITLVLLVGMMLAPAYWRIETVWLAPLLFLIIRPIAVFFGTLGCEQTSLQRTLVGWFGIRGIGSIYYLMFAVEHDMPPWLAEKITGIVLSLIAVSILVHGISVTPIMSLYESRKRSPRARGPTD